MENNTTILIVDDEEAGREALEGVLFSQGYQLIKAKNGQEAFEMAQEFMPDLILLDVMMPHIDGFEVCKRMRKDLLLAEIPILLVTALDDRVSRIKGIEAGADDFITKPFDRIELRARVRTITRLNRYRRLMLERARFVWVAEQAKEGYVILNAKDEIKYVNPAGKLLLSLPADDTIIISFLDWVHKQFVCQPEEVWARWSQPDLSDETFFLIQPETDTRHSVWLQVELLCLPVGNETNRMVRISEVTEKLALYQEVWSFNKTIVHKLRTPIANMVMAADLFRHQAVGKVPEEIAELSEMILLGLKRIRGEIEDILTYCNMTNVAKTGSHFNLSSMNGIISKIAADLGLDKVNYTVDNALPKDYPIQLSNRAVEVILWEIVENSKKFHPQYNPTLDVHISLHGSNAMQISIRDDGVSLAPEQLRQAWQPYYQGEKEFTGEIDGMGLGLSNVAKLVWEVGGKYRIINREDRPGVIVDLVLPSAIHMPSLKPVIGQKSPYG